MLVCMTAVDDVTFVRRDVSRVRSQVVDDTMNLNRNAECIFVTKEEMKEDIKKKKVR